VPEEYENFCNFPNYVGAVDGNHIVLQFPFKNGGESCNYMGTFSLILLAAMNASHSFLFISVGFFLDMYWQTHV
jgi:hypothetical protein